MNRLPKELWKAIFGFLDYRDIHNRAELVSKEWYYMCWHELRHLNLEPYLYELGSELLVNLLYKPVENLQTLKLRDDVTVTQHSLYLFTVLKNLELIYLSDVRVLSDEYKDLVSFLSTNLQTIRISLCQFIPYLTSLKKLTNIELYQAQLMDENFASLCQITSITSLHIAQPIFFHTPYIATLTTLTAMKRLLIEQPASYFLPLEFDSLMSFCNLQTLLLTISSPSAYVTANLAPLQYLTRLEMLIFTPGVTVSPPESDILPLVCLTSLLTLILPLKCPPHALAPLSKLTNLKILNISSLTMQPEIVGMCFFENLHQTEDIDVNDINARDETDIRAANVNKTFDLSQTFEQFSNLQKLNSIGLSSDFPLEGFRSLGKILSLTSLQVDHVPSGNVWWTNELSQLVNLQSLSVVFTDAMARVLPRLTTLRTLRLKGIKFALGKSPSAIDFNSLSQLHTLFLANFDMPFELLLRKLTNLHTLSITHSEILSSTFEEIGALTTLTHLDLSLSKIAQTSDTTFVLKPLSSLIHLKVLHLTGSYKVPLPLFDFLSNFTSLEVLSCWRTIKSKEVDIIGLTLTRLREIYVHSAHLDWMLPKLKILPICSVCVPRNY
jgi:hypothetical protein